MSEWLCVPAQEPCARFLWPGAPLKIPFPFSQVSVSKRGCQGAKNLHLFMALQPMKNAGSLETNYWFHGNIYHQGECDVPAGTLLAVAEPITMKFDKGFFVCFFLCKVFTTTSLTTETNWEDTRLAWPDISMVSIWPT